MKKKINWLKGRKCLLQKKGLIFPPTTGSSVSDGSLNSVRKQISPEEGDIKSLWNSKQLMFSFQGAQSRTMLILSKTPTAPGEFQVPLNHELFMSLLPCSLFCVWFPNEPRWHLLDEPNSSEPSSLDSALSARRGGIFTWQVFPSPGPGFLTHVKAHKHPFVTRCLTYRALDRVLLQSF